MSRAMREMCFRDMGELMKIKISLFSKPYTVKLKWLHHRWLVHHGWIELGFEFPLENSFDGSRKNIYAEFREMFLSYHENLRCASSLEFPNRGDSNEYSQHAIIFYKRPKRHP